MSSHVSQKRATNHLERTAITAPSWRSKMAQRIDDLRTTPRTRRRVFAISGAALVSVAVIVAFAFYLTQQRAAQTPAYPTLAPKGTSIETLGGWKRVSPPKKDPVFAYADTLEGVNISVSQQPLPASFKDDVASQVAALAKQFNATTKLSAGATTAYIGTSAKGPQSVIFTKNDLLILIKSQSKVSDSAWIRYVQLLDPGS